MGSCIEPACAGCGKVSGTGTSEGAKVWEDSGAGCMSGEGCVASESLESCDSVVVEPLRWGVEGSLAAAAARGEVAVGAESGAVSLTMETTIFSKSSEEMWRSLLLRLLTVESRRCILGRISTGADSEMKSLASSSATESTLPESCGSSGVRFATGTGLVGVWEVVVAVVSSWAVAFFAFSVSISCSLCHNLQLRFSNLRPCSTESAQREKTVHML